MKALLQFALVALLFASNANAQQDTASVLDAVSRLETALTTRNVGSLDVLLHPEVVFGHSNGMTQTKQQVIDDTEKGTVVYKKFNTEYRGIQRYGKRAIVREYVVVEGVNKSVDFKVRLYVVQEWVKGRKGWQLILRQGAKQQL